MPSLLGLLKNNDRAPTRSVIIFKKGLGSQALSYIKQFPSYMSLSLLFNFHTSLYKITGSKSATTPILLDYWTKGACLYNSIMAMPT